MTKKKKKVLDQSEEKDFELEDEESKESESSEDLENVDESAKEKPSSEEKEEGEEEGKEEEEEESFIPEDEEVDERLRPALSKIEARMKSAFNKKLTEFDKQRKGKVVVESFDQLLENPQFMEWANKQLGDRGTGMDISQFSMDEAVQQWNSLNDVQRRQYFTSLKPEDRKLFKLQLQIAMITQQAYGSREAELESKVIEKFKDVYSSRKDAVSRLRKEIQTQPYLTHEEAFKMLDYEDYGKRMLELGKLEAKKKVKDLTMLPPKTGSKGKTSKAKASSIKEAFEQAQIEEAGAEE